MAAVTPPPVGSFLGHYDRDVDIAWIRFAGYEGGTAVSSEKPWGLEERDAETGSVVAVEIWHASERLPNAFLALLPEPTTVSWHEELARRIDDALDWLSIHYWDQPFWMERDVVWTLQRRLTDVLEDVGDGVQVVHNLNTSVGHVDLAVLVDGTTLAVIECKYEPARHRRDFATGRLTQAVVFWDSSGVLEDIRRITAAVDSGDAPIGYAIFFDEGGRFRHREPPPVSSWLDWGFDAANVSVLLTRVDASNVRAAHEWALADASRVTSIVRATTLSPTEIANALDTLAGRDREVLEALLGGATQAEVGRRLGISTARVAQLAKRGRERLAEIGVSPEALGLPSRGRRRRRS
jgi:uncharacterized protein YuzE/DNA-binding CsgD family transcriptional regulator